MFIEVKPVDDCCECVFCEDMIYCKLKDGEKCDFDYEHGRMIASFCPLVNPLEKVTDKVKIHVCRN